MEREALIKKVKENKKYKNISDEVVLQKIDDYAKKNPRYTDYPEKIIVKDLRAILHKIHGSFQVSSKKKREYFKELEKNPQSRETIEKILQTNTSTKERLKIYPELYKRIFEMTGKPKSILDLGCGLNPISFDYMGLDQVDYYAYDINEEDSIYLNDFFMIKKIRGVSRTQDLGKIENIKKLENADVCFMFKLLDVLEKKGHLYSEELIKQVREKCKYLIVSFATASLGGKRMTYARRGWIERMLSRIGLKFEKLEFENEVFYVISN